MNEDDMRSADARGSADASQSRWTPRRRGHVYCSPRCGAGCTHKAYERATREAAKLAASLGEGWEPDVWENLGWHYSASKGVVRVHVNMERGGTISGDWKVAGYTAFFNGAVSLTASAKTADDALGFLLQEVRGIERRIAADCAALLT